MVTAFCVRGSKVKCSKEVIVDLNGIPKRLYYFVLQGSTPALLSTLLIGCSMVSCLPLLETCFCIFVINFLHCITSLSRMTEAG